MWIWPTSRENSTGCAYSRNPKDETAALRFAQALKATGEKDHAESLLQQADGLTQAIAVFRVGGDAVAA